MIWNEQGAVPNLCVWRAQMRGGGRIRITPEEQSSLDFGVSISFLA